MATVAGNVSVGDFTQRIAQLVIDGQAKDAQIAEFQEELKQKDKEISIIKDRLSKRVDEDKKIINDLKDENKMAMDTLRAYKGMEEQFKMLKKKCQELENKIDDISKTTMINKGLNKE